MAKPVHLMRTTRPDLMSEFIDEFEKIQILIMESLFRLKIELFFFNLLCFPSVKGGIGIQKTRDVSPAAFTASMSQFMQTASCPVKIEDLRNTLPLDLTPRWREFIDSSKNGERRKCEKTYSRLFSVVCGWRKCIITQNKQVIIKRRANGRGEKIFIWGRNNFFYN
jgi:hypothetical protein